VFGVVLLLAAIVHFFLKSRERHAREARSFSQAKVIEVAQTGMRDPARIGQLALEEIGMSGGKGPA